MTSKHFFDFSNDSQSNRRTEISSVITRTLPYELNYICLGKVEVNQAELRHLNEGKVLFHIDFLSIPESINDQEAAPVTLKCIYWFRGNETNIAVYLDSLQRLIWNQRFNSDLWSGCSLVDQVNYIITITSLTELWRPQNMCSFCFWLIWMRK